MSPFLGEFVGTALLILLGSGVVANVVLNQTKGNSGGWIVIAFGWAMAVFIGVYTSQRFGGGGHLNPAISIAFALFGDFDTGLLSAYLSGQFLGAMAGAVLAWVCYKKHFDVSGNADLKLAVFCTGPAIRNPLFNFLTEVIATFVLVFGASAVSKPTDALGTLNALPAGLIVLAIGLSLGGPTGYAINPARDLAPRLAHFLLPIPGKRDSDWSYAWIPVIGPVAGAILATLAYNATL